MVKEWIAQYAPRNKNETEQALREILQEIALAGLAKSNFFQIAAFYGGTALRIFHGLPRFSEDMDFTLLAAEPDFDLSPYSKVIVEQFQSLGIDVTVIEKVKSRGTQIDSAFLKPDTIWKELILNELNPAENMGLLPDLKIKIEVDTDPPPAFQTEPKLALQPYSFYVSCVTLPDLFAGKMHALLFRKWINRVKGRDWYDLEWCVRKQIPVNLDHLLARMIQLGQWKKKTFTRNDLVEMLIKKIDDISINQLREDVVRFIPDRKSLDIWSQQYFKDLIQLIKIK